MNSHLSRLVQQVRDGLGISSLQERVDSIDRRLVDTNESTGALLSRIEALATAANTGVYPLRPRGHDQAIQHLLRLRYKELIDAGRPLPAFDDVEMRFHSQNGEDGIIQLLIAAVGTEAKRSVEICAGDGIQCNTANLIINHGWNGLLVDGNEELVTRGRHFYEGCSDTWIVPPTFRQVRVTAENINQVVEDAGFNGDIDLLSIDLDGIDYWIWKALNCIRPRIVVVECIWIWGPNETLTIPYDPDFVWESGSPYVGATIGAMCKLGSEKGYRFVGTQRYGFNAFFIRDDLAGDILPAIQPEQCLGNLYIKDSTSKTDAVRNRPWVQV